MAEQQSHIQQLGHYRLVRLLGQGGFAEVYLGEHVHLNTSVAVKILHTRLTESDVQDFRREAQVVARLVHPHIVRVLDFGVEQSVPYLVMDYAPSGSLRHRYPKGTRLPLATVVALAGQVADALQYAHDQRLIHRDVKPENMLLGTRGEVLLSDFGLALVLQSSSVDRTQNIAGTVAYMAPEQIRAHPGPASDQYALAIVVYEWLCGKRPFDGSYTEIAVKHSVAPPPPLRALAPDLPEAVEQVVMHALQKEPQQRFPSVRDFAQALTQAAQGGVASERFIPTFVNPSPPTPGGMPISALPTLQVPPSAATNVGPTLTPQPMASAQGAGMPTPAMPQGMSTPAMPQNMLTPTPTSQPLSGPMTWSPQGQPQGMPSVQYTPPISPPNGWQPGAGQIAPPLSTAPVWGQPMPSNLTYPMMPQTPRRFSRRAMLLGGGIGLVALAGGAYWLLRTHPYVDVPGVGTVAVPEVPVQMYSEHQGAVLKVGWSPNGKYIASGSEDTTLKIWNADTAKTVLSAHTIKQPADADDYPWSLSWSAKNNLLAVAFVDGTIQVLDPASGGRVNQFDSDFPPPDLAWSPDEKYLAISGTDDAIYVYSYPEWKVVQTYTQHTDSIEALAWSPDGKYIVSGADDTKVRVWDPLSGQTKIVYQKHTDRIVSVCWSPDSKAVLSSSWDYNAVAWEIESGRVLFTYKGRGGAPMGMATWSHNGKYVAVYDGDAEVVLLDAATGKTRRRIESGVVYGIAWSPDDKRLVTGCYENAAKIWEVGVE